MTFSPEQATPMIRTWVLTEGDKLAIDAKEDTLEGVAFLLSWRILRESSHVFINDDPDTNEYDTDLLRLAKFPDKDFLLWHNISYGEGKKEAREATEAPPEGGRPFRAG